VKIASLETRHYRYPLEPPFVAAWDPEPRRFQDATVAIVRSDDGIEGYASGDALPDRELLQRLLVGLEVSDTDAVHGIVETVDFHHGRNWIAEVAVWDLLGRARNEPLWLLLGGTRARILACASTGELVTPGERARRCVALRDAGTRREARLHSTDWRGDLPVLEAACATRSAESSSSWSTRTRGGGCPGISRPAGRSRPRREFARAAERLDVSGSSEPLPTADLGGTRSLRARPTCASRPARWSAPRPRPATSSSAAECTSSSPTSSSPAASPARGRSPSSPPRASAWWSPHTWSNGYGLLVNLRRCVLDLPLPRGSVRPPAWTAERRDWLLPVTIEIADDGTVGPPAGAGLGVVPDFDALEQYRTA
jgi:hypothetical protein